MSNEILRLPQLKTKVGLSRSSIYSAVSQGKFPRPIKLGARAIGWIASEVDTWLAGQIQQSRRTQAGLSRASEER
jgi:prophage regulatory protein